jgi:hypothetical protein
MKTFDHIASYFSGKHPSRMGDNPSDNLASVAGAGKGGIHEPFNGLPAIRPPSRIPGSSKIGPPYLHGDHPLLLTIRYLGISGILNFRNLEFSLLP